MTTIDVAPRLPPRPGPTEDPRGALRPTSRSGGPDRPSGNRRPRLHRLVAALALLASTAPARGVDASASREVAQLANLERGILHESVAAGAGDGAYALYLPSDLAAGSRAPLLLVLSPGDSALSAARIFVPAAERWGWILVSARRITSGGRSWDHNVEVVNSVLPDAMRRLPVDPRRVYAAGMSAGAMLSWIIGQQTGSLAGVISVGGRPPEGYTSSPPRFAFWAAAGRHDFNYEPTRSLDALARSGDRPCRFEPFAGRHEWFSADEATRALGWMEMVAMREGLRPIDRDVVDRLLGVEVAGVDELETAGFALDALRRLRSIAETFRGLVDAEKIASLTSRADALERSSAIARARRDEKWGQRYESGIRRKLAEVELELHVAEPILMAPRIRSMLGLKDLVARSRAVGPRGDAAARALEIVLARLSWGEVETLFLAQEHMRALPALEVALELEPDNPWTWYSLACAQAHAGRLDEAIASLERVEALGGRVAESIADDPDIAPLRKHPRFAELANRLLGPPAARTDP